MKTKSTAKLKKDLDAIFSKYIRLKYSDKNGRTFCYTCNKPLHWKEAQCGHFISRSHLATRFDEDNCRVQCVGCNVFGSGKPIEFGLNLENESKGIVMRLMKKSQKIVKDYPYISEIKRYKQLVDNYLDL